MKIDLNKLINNILLFIIMLILIYMIPILKDLSLNGRFQVSSSSDGDTFIDTRTGESYTSFPKSVNIDTSLWKKIPHTKPIIEVK